MSVGTVRLNGHAVAEQWASTHEAMKAADERARLASAEVSRLRDALCRLSEDLVSRVGRNISHRAYQVSPSQIVLVQDGQSVRLVEVEAR